MEKRWVKRDVRNTVGDAGMTGIRAYRGLFLFLLIVMALAPFSTSFAQDTNIKYIYDDLNRLTRIEYADGTVTEYDYNEIGDRLQKTTYAPVEITTVIGEGIGTISPSGPIDAGHESVNVFTFTTNPITESCSVVVNFIQIHTVTPSGGQNGTIDPNTPQPVGNGLTMSFTVTPGTGYHAVMSGTCGGMLNGTSYTTNAITADCTVTATFAINTYAVTLSVSGNGSITPTTPQTINHGSTVTFTLTAAEHYHINNVTGNCGGSLVGNVFTTNEITADCSVQANFAIDTYTLNVAHPAGGEVTSSPAGVNAAPIARSLMITIRRWR